MKRFNFGLLLAAGSLFLGTLAQADFRPGRVRSTLASTSMNEVSFDGQVLRKNVGSLTAQSMDGKAGYVSFTLAVKARIFCVTAPCPQPTFTTVYRVTGSEQEGKNRVQYTAINDQSGSQITVMLDTERMDFFIDESPLEDTSNPYRHFAGEMEPLFVTM